LRTALRKERRGVRQLRRDAGRPAAAPDQRQRPPGRGDSDQRRAQLGRRTQAPHAWKVTSTEPGLRPLLADLVEAGPGELVRDHDWVELDVCVEVQEEGLGDLRGPGGVPDTRAEDLSR